MTDQPAAPNLPDRMPRWLWKAVAIFWIGY